jgi:alkylated DNA repair protein alkB family protein 1
MSCIAKADERGETGLVFFPSILPEPLQRSLVVESLQNARQPNVTSLDPHYQLPREGLWNAWNSGKGEEFVESLDFRSLPPTASTSGGEPIITGSKSSTDSLSAASAKAIDSKSKEMTVRDLIPKLRWSNVGYHYNVCELIPSH